MGIERSMTDASYWFGSSVIAITSSSHAPKFICSSVNERLKLTKRIKTKKNKSYPLQDHFELFTDSEGTIVLFSSMSTFILRGFLPFTSIFICIVFLLKYGLNCSMNEKKKIFKCCFFKKKCINRLGKLLKCFHYTED